MLRVPHCQLKSLSLRVRRGVRVVVVGDNGCGKSSLLRCVAGIWAPAGGTVHVPAAGVMYLPQRVYVPTFATLRQQLSYGTPGCRCDRVPGVGWAQLG